MVAAVLTRSLALLVALPLVAAISGFGQDAAPAVSTPAMQRPFEGLYSAWREAMEKQDINGWQQVTAQSRQMRTRNEIVSQRMRYPEALFDSPVRAPELRGLVCVDTLVRGDTASSVYFGRADFGLGDPTEVRDNFVVLRFIREFGVWKFDNLRVVKFGDDAEVLAKVRNRDRSYLEAPEFQPDAAPPAVPGAVNAPDYLAELWVTAAGYETTITVNGQHQTAITNDSGRELVMGGLVKGVNRIKVTVKPAEIESGVPRHLEIGIYGAAKPEDEAKRFYHFRASAEADAAGYESTFTVP